jgi:hypothetical protein
MQPLPRSGALGETPIYQLDPSCVVRAALQATPDAAAPVAWMGSEWMTRLGLTEGVQARVSQGEAVVLPLRRDDRLAVGVFVCRRASADRVAGCASRPDQRGEDLTWMLATRPVAELLGPAWLPIWTLVKIMPSSRR